MEGSEHFEKAVWLLLDDVQSLITRNSSRTLQHYHLHFEQPLADYHPLWHPVKLLHLFIVLIKGRTKCNLPLGFQQADLLVGRVDPDELLVVVLLAFVDLVVVLLAFVA